LARGYYVGCFWPLAGYFLIIMNLKNKNILVVGLGQHGGGLGVVKYLVQKGAKVRVTDLKNKEELQSPLKKIAELPLKYTLGKHCQEDFLFCDLIIRNPAVPQDSPYLCRARKAGIPIEMEIGLFLDQSPSHKIIGITGTKGKTTTAWLIYQILKEQQPTTVIGGNMRLSILDLLPKIKKNSWIVLELSSWQLEGLKTKKFSPPISLITNIYRDHLNRYRTMEKYVQAKKLIFQYQNKNDHLILNQNNPWSKKFAQKAKGKIHFFDAEQVPYSIKKNTKLKGKHNLANIAAALKVAQIINIEPTAAQKTIINFAGIPHRLEKISQKGGITFYNDTTATNPSAAQAALESFKKPVIWLAGGADKNLLFQRLAKTVQKSTVKAVILLKGSATNKLQKNLKKYCPTLPLYGPFDNFPHAVQKAYQVAQNNQIILLSPAAASFGMFENEFDRGRKFKKIIHNLDEKNK